MLENEKNVFAEYEELSIKIKELTAQQKELKPEILEKMQDDDQLDTELGGNFTIRFRDKFTYSEDLQIKADEFKVLKKAEEIDGVAVNTPTRYVQYTSAKVKKTA